ncbi:uncharacterized protein V1510DRAFT_424134 [Dipodascopsis tothii]|uniref:uncharacterized protein n=1 Tax=Dipodascopsis tothii TaxID=44089 RepID=UPI0034CD4FF2
MNALELPVASMVGRPVGRPPASDEPLSTTEQVTVYLCPVQGCDTKTYAKRGRRAILRHLKTKSAADVEHLRALAQYSTREPMTKQERSRKTSATYREKHQLLAQAAAQAAGEPALAPLYNHVLVKKHEAYVYKKVRAALDAVPRPVFPAELDAGKPEKDVREPPGAAMEANLLWILQEMDHRIYFPPDADVHTVLNKDDVTLMAFYKRRLRELAEQYPHKAAGFDTAVAQLENDDLLRQAIAEFQDWKRQDELARAKHQLDLEQHERDRVQANRIIEEYDRERTAEAIQARVREEMDRWRAKMTEKLRAQHRH